MSTLPTHEALMGVFDNHWSEELWTKIEAERDANGFNLNESIWNIANNAQEKAYAIIKDAEQKGTTFGQVKKDLAALLSEKGKANMGYNVRRLWVNQVKTDRIIAQKSVWQDMGYVESVILSRSHNGLPCEICDEEVGEGPDAERVVPLDYGNWPPFHPWCECDAQPEKPSAKSIAAFLKGETGSPKMMTFMKEMNPLAEENPTPTTPMLTDEELAVLKTSEEQDVSNEFEAHNVKLFDEQLGTLVTQMEKLNYPYGHTARFSSILRDSLGGIIPYLTPPKMEVGELAGKALSAAQYTASTETISIANFLVLLGSSPEELAGSVIHEYGHHIILTLSENMSALDSLATAEKDILYGNASGLIQAIERNATRATTDILTESTEKPDIADIEARLNKAMEWATNFADADGYGVASPMQQALSDMGFGNLDKMAGHDMFYLENVLATVRVDSTWDMQQRPNPNPPMHTYVGMAVHEAFNEWWEYYTRVGGNPSDGAKEMMNTYLPGLLPALDKWYRFAGGKS